MPLRYLASIRWRQLLSHWKHTAFAKSLAEKASSFHYIRDDEDNDLSDDEDKSYSSSGRRRVKKRETLELVRSLRQSSQPIHPSTKNLNGLLPHLGDGEYRTLTGFLLEFGSRPDGVSSTNTSKADKVKQHPLSHTGIYSRGKPTTSTLVDAAAAFLQRFASFTEEIVHFAAQNHATTSDSQVTEVSYSVGIKSDGAIEKKARRKYGGDILQVKDILRAQITFGDEGSLVAGLLHLRKLCGKSKDSSFTVEIVRVKNLFHKRPSGELCPSLLPTGYRHILINVRVNDSMLAGKPLRFFPFDVAIPLYFHLTIFLCLLQQSFNFN